MCKKQYGESLVSIFPLLVKLFHLVLRELSQKLFGFLTWRQKRCWREDCCGTWCGRSRCSRVRIILKLKFIIKILRNVGRGEGVRRRQGRSDLRNFSWMESFFWPHREAAIFFANTTPLPNPCPRVDL